MKNGFKLIGIIAALAVIGLAATSCERGGAAGLQGTWVFAEDGTTVTMTFDNGNIVMRFADEWSSETMTGTYTVTDNFINLTFEVYGHPQSTSMEFSLSGNTLTIDDGEEMVLTRQ